MRFTEYRYFEKSAELIHDANMVKKYGILTNASRSSIPFLLHIHSFGMSVNEMNFRPLK